MLCKLYCLQKVAGDAGYMVYVTGTYEITRRKLDGKSPNAIFPANLVEITSIAVHDHWVGGGC